MKSYTDRNGKTWTPAERMKSLQKTKEAIASGQIPPATRCERCGQTEGIVQYHNHDYSSPTEHLEAMCWRCHMMFHSFFRAREQVLKYWDEIRAGKRYPPVYSSDFSVLYRDHGVPMREPTQPKPPSNHTLERFGFN